MAELERCVDCGAVLPPRDPRSPAVRRCEDDWWAHQESLPAEDRHVMYKEISKISSRKLADL